MRNPIQMIICLLLLFPFAEASAAGKCKPTKIKDLTAAIANNCNKDGSVFSRAVPNSKQRGQFCKCLSEGHAQYRKTQKALYAEKEYFILCLHTRTATDQQYQSPQFTEIVDLDAALMDDCLNKAGVKVDE